MKDFFRVFNVAGQQSLAAVMQCTVPCKCQSAHCGGMMLVDAVALSTMFDGERVQLTLDHRSNDPGAPYALLDSLTEAHVADLVQVMAAGYFQTMSASAMAAEMQQIMNRVLGREMPAVRFGQI